MHVSYNLFIIELWVFYRNNTKSIIGQDFRIQVFASTNIEPGQEITNKYIKSDKPSYIRRPLLRQKWFFDCYCSRCSDPTELGSHLSSLVCGKTRCDGAVVPIDSLDSQSNWHCLECNAIVPVEKVHKILELAIRESAISDTEMETNPVHLEQLLYHLSKNLHPYNHLIINLKQKLVSLYSNAKSIPARQRIIQLCLDVMDCLDKVRKHFPHMMFKNSVCRLKRATHH